MDPRVMTWPSSEQPLTPDRKVGVWRRLKVSSALAQALACTNCLPFVPYRSFRVRPLPTAALQHTAPKLLGGEAPFLSNERRRRCAVWRVDSAPEPSGYPMGSLSRVRFARFTKVVFRPLNRRRKGFARSNAIAATIRMLSFRMRREIFSALGNGGV